MASVLSVADLSDDDIDRILARARQFRDAQSTGVRQRPRLLGLVFLEPSLRTRVGFAAAAARLGWQTVEVVELRHSPSSMTESWADTLRAVAGYSDVVVARPGVALKHGRLTRQSVCSLVNGGDVGPRAEHPSQALIDAFAMEELVGPIELLRIAIVGDPRMRAVRSLLALFARRPPEEIVLVADPEHLAEADLPVGLRSRQRVGSWAELTDVNVVYVAGIPHGALPLERRDALLATAARVENLAPSCVLLSPMPVIDEMDVAVRHCPRNRMHQQSDLGLYVRMALLEHAAGPDH